MMCHPTWHQMDNVSQSPKLCSLGRPFEWAQCKVYETMPCGNFLTLLRVHANSLSKPFVGGNVEVVGVCFTLKGFGGTKKRVMQMNECILYMKSYMAQKWIIFPTIVDFNFHMNLTSLPRHLKLHKRIKLKLLEIQSSGTKLQ